MPTNATTLPSSFFTSFTPLKFPLGGSGIFQPVKSFPLKSSIQPSSDFLSSAVTPGSAERDAAVAIAVNAITERNRYTVCIETPASVRARGSAEPSRLILLVQSHFRHHSPQSRQLLLSV